MDGGRCNKEKLVGKGGGIGKKGVCERAWIIRRREEGAKDQQVT